VEKVYYREVSMARAPQEVTLNAGEIARRAAETVAEALATDVQVLDLQRLTPFFDLFVICSADNTRQLRAMYLRVLEALSEAGVEPLRREGEPESGWVVLDYGSVLVHLFTREQRSFYRLEERWAEAQRVLVIQ
jgi:ribosome-associated protein